MRTRYLFFRYKIICHWLIGAMLLAIFVASRYSHALNSEAMNTPPTNTLRGIATFAGGCFWCTEADFDKLLGVTSTTSGYIGGSVKSPTYEQVVSGKTGHVEAVQVYFDTTQTDFAKLLAAYWRTIDPLTPNRQFCDIGEQYRSVIFYHDVHQRQQAEASKASLRASGRFTQPIVTDILAATTFYAAEEYHQNYYRKNPIRYRYYRGNCGRDKRLEQLWGKKN